jgi:hypothetical protein
VDSFEDGRLNILEEVPEELKNLDNPYDDSQRKMDLLFIGPPLLRRELLFLL